MSFYDRTHTLLHESPKGWEEVQSDLFRESGVNASTDPAKIRKYAEAMRRYGGWGDFPPIHGVVQTVWEDDVEEYEEAAEEGYEWELAWSRPPERGDIGTTFVAIEDGHNRAYAAREAGIPIRVKKW